MKAEVKIAAKRNNGICRAIILNNVWMYAYIGKASAGT